MSDDVTRSWWQSLARGMLHLLYPPCCHLCGRSIHDNDLHFCDGCAAALNASSLPACPRCASIIGPFTSTVEGCPSCQREKFAFSAAERYGIYDGILREAVLRMKHASGELLAELLGQTWATHAGEELLAHHPTVIVPIPLHWTRRWSRGYNQSLALARGLSDVLSVPVNAKVLFRNRRTLRQSLLSEALRRTNVIDAFSVASGVSLREHTVLLVDDVMTTGTTVHEAARVLKRAKAKTVVVAVLARAGRQAGQSLPS